MTLIDRILSQARRLTYWLGFNPRPGSILYSPSRAMMRALRDLGQTVFDSVAEAMTETTKQISELRRVMEQGESKP